jgi:hypothetical protein
MKSELPSIVSWPCFAEAPHSDSDSESSDTLQEPIELLKMSLNE